MRLGLTIIFVLVCIRIMGDGPMVDSIEANPPDRCSLVMTFNEGSGAKDWSVKENDGSVVGATWSETGTESGTYDFDGSTDYIQLHADSIDWALDFTISTWVYFLGTTGSGNTIVGGSPDGSTYCYFGIDASDRFHFDAYDGDSRADTLTSGSLVPLNIWVHCVVTKKTGDSVILYLNGISDGVDSSITSFPDVVARIGCLGPTYEAYRFPGKIDEVYIYDYVLSLTEIKELYERGKVGR